ncbi:MAG: sugar ABC transporter substrate-binding protein [Eubacteriales bacterium]|nr:sugar ABC transporter substrate-binding protein [Eubacteriales bacterium]
MKKRIISMTLAAAVSVGCLAGCGGGGESAATGSAAASSSSSGGKSIAVMMHSVADEYIYSLGSRAQEYAESLGYTVTFYNADNEADTQASQISDVIASGVDGILLCPVDADALSDSVKEINEAGIPVALADRTVTEGDYVALNQADNYECGYQGAQALVDQCKAQGIDVKDMKVLELMGDLASTSGKERSEGFQAAAKDMGFEIVSSLPTYWESDTAYNATLDALQSDPDINAIYAASDGVMADSIVNALDQVDRLAKRGEDGHIVIATVDGTPGVIQYIKDGSIDAACAQPAYDIGEAAIDYVISAMEGKEKLDACIDNSMAPTIITEDNADSDDLWGNNVG